MSIVNNKGKDMPQQILGTTVQKTDDAVGIFRNDQEKKHWYVAVVNNRSEKAGGGLCALGNSKFMSLSNRR